MNSMNFFSWIRDGVRQSVLLGVSDAVDQLGTPFADEELNPNVSGFLSSAPTTASAAPRIAERTAGKTGGRKRLGKSLKDMGPSQAK